MIVKGQYKELKYTNVAIKISPKQVLYDIYWSLLKDKPNKASYIRDGYWYVEDYFDYHKRENVEEKDRAVTDAEQKIYEAYSTLKDLL